MPRATVLTASLTQTVWDDERAAAMTNPKGYVTKLIPGSYYLTRSGMVFLAQDDDMWANAKIVKRADERMLALAFAHSVAAKAIFGDAHSMYIQAPSVGSQVSLFDGGAWSTGSDRLVPERESLRDAMYPYHAYKELVP